ncbi:wax ester/triacylglycerol synthase domain-containing protein [Nocardia wallacei]|uniref:wax ester/triacylglycerol synthase domain-containing protein n=1 Tax=Nocardia wallacei TaxID=480035 RepID=UPI0024560C09|nr:wax ester/triacylglycerol synthase domain-containing protein [Nocardia wallacei]
MAAIDLVLLTAETPRQPGHVALLQIFEPPSSADEDNLRGLFDTLCSYTEPDQDFLRCPFILPGLGPVLWVQEHQIDLFHHLVHIALPTPGDMSQLMDTVGRLHAPPLDRRLPLWQILDRGLVGRAVRGLQQNGIQRCSTTLLLHAVTRAF